MILHPLNIIHKDFTHTPEKIQGYKPKYNLGVTENKPQYNFSQPEVIPEDTSRITGTQEFEQAFDKVIQLDPSAQKYRNLLTNIAKHESGFKRNAKNPNAPAYGYFQFMQDDKKYNNITHYAKTDINTFQNDPVLQIQAAVNLAKANERTFNEEDIQAAQEKGISMNGLIGGAWLGGVGGVRKLLYKDQNISDKHWSPSGAGVDMITQIGRYNKLKEGGNIPKKEILHWLKTNDVPFLPKEVQDATVNKLQNDLPLNFNALKQDDHFQRRVGGNNNLVIRYMDDMNTYLKNKGLNRPQIHAIMSMVAQESGFNPLAKNPNSSAYGYGQWLEPRYNGINPDETNSSSAHIRQLDMLYNTIVNGDTKNDWHHGGKGSGYSGAQHAKDSFLNADTSEKALHALIYGYTRPFNDEYPATKIFPNYKKMLNSLNKLYE